ncbi:MAG: hypothetical protein NTW87_23170 [Planctomycetota bacterium]|nr:hypothetical protein [Planctomycetota bacterium]
MRTVVPMVLAALLAIPCCHAGADKNATWESAMNAALEKVKAGEHAYVIDNMLAPELVAQLKEKYGKDNWKDKFLTRLKRVEYYYSKLKDPKVEVSGNKTTVRGEYGCYAEFIKADGVYLLGDFGQIPTSM